MCSTLRAQLRGFEQNALRGEATLSGQSDLFVAGYDADPASLADADDSARQETATALIDELKSLDVDELSPRQALDVLDRLKQLADEDFPSD